MDTPNPDDRIGAPDMAVATMGDLRLALRRGRADFQKSPVFGLIFAAVYVVVGWIMAAITLATEQTYWLVLAVISFPLLGSFAAVGLYEVSRRRSVGAAMDWHRIFGVVKGQGSRQLPWLSAVVVIMVLFWFFLAHMIFALFMGLAPMTNVSSSAAVFLTPNGLTMLAVGSVVGAAFALLIYAITVVGLPMVVEREIDFVSAMIASFETVTQAPLVMLSWAVFVAVVTVIAMVPGFLGLFVVLPVLGHATWHLYRILVERASERAS